MRLRRHLKKLGALRQGHCRPLMLAGVNLGQEDCLFLLQLEARGRAYKLIAEVVGGFCSLQGRCFAFCTGGSVFLDR